MEGTKFTQEYIIPARLVENTAAVEHYRELNQVALWHKFLKDILSGGQYHVVRAVETSERIMPREWPLTEDAYDLKIRFSIEHYPVQYHEVHMMRPPDYSLMSAASLVPDAWEEVKRRVRRKVSGWLRRH